MANRKYNAADFESVDFSKGYTSRELQRGEENTFVREDDLTQPKYSTQELVLRQDDLGAPASPPPSETQSYQDCASIWRGRGPGESAVGRL